MTTLQQQNNAVADLGRLETPSGLAGLELDRSSLNKE
jgi:hypothetical protein